MKEQVVDLAMYNAGIRNPQGLAVNPGAARYGCMNTVCAVAMKLTYRKRQNYGWPLATWGVNYSGLKVPETKGEIVEGTEQSVYYWKDSPAISGMAFISATFLCRDGINCLSAR